MSRLRLTRDKQPRTFTSTFIFSFMNRAVHIEFLSLDFQKAMEGSRKHSLRYPYIHYTKHLKKPVMASAVGKTQ